MLLALAGLVGASPRGEPGAPGHALDGVQRTRPAGPLDAAIHPVVPPLERGLRSTLALGLDGALETNGSGHTRVGGSLAGTRGARTLLRPGRLLRGQGASSFAPPRPRLSAGFVPDRSTAPPLRG